ncbi:unnamed protein product [Heterotrigona itama]|uniref:Major facilitator superfamily (MFS) profile domain-containing protein n=1 Tax=Heterotrigona itama TaxID=395501 RepID=A0A6V7HK89_9HYME|nr:unnamed protein product [Heterotrigona itama]
MPVCGFLIAYLGWESVFYVTGTIGLAWSVAWFLLIFDSPGQHPRITIEERRYIEDSIGSTSTTKLEHFTRFFSIDLIVSLAPSQNGMLSSLPYLGKYIFAVATSSVADYLFKTNRLSITTIPVLSPGLLMIVQANYGCDRVTSVSIFTIALTINGAVTAGYLGNGLDIAPNFSGTIFGMMNTLGSLGGFLSSYMVGSITYKNQTYARWSRVFWTLASTYCFGAITFAIFGSGQLQTWNNPEQRQEDERTKMADVADHPEEFLPLKDKTVP